MKNQQFIDGVYQNTSTAIQSINDLYPKVKSANLKKMLKEQEKGYSSIQEKCKKVAEELGEKPKDNNFFEKARLWTSINMGTITDTSARHLAEMMTIGTVMGIINCYKLMSDFKLCNEKIHKVCQELVELEEKYLEDLKIYLKK